MITTKENTGLTERDLDTIEKVFDSCANVREVWIFGSRAKGNYKPGSDIDLAIMNSGIALQDLLFLQGKFESSSLPYKLDVVNYQALKNEQLKEHIDRVGKPFYKK